MGGTVSTIGRGVAGGLTGGLSELGRKNPFGGGVVGRGLSAGITGGLSEFGQRNPFGVPIDNPYAIWGKKSDGSKSVPGPFELNQGQFDADRAAINTEGQKQYDETIAGLHDVSGANTQRAKDLFGEMLPDIAENAQAAHLYDSSGYGNEVARQQSSIASQIANEEAQQKQAALAGRQGFQTGALQRGLSMEDFINQANVAKTIGAQMAPAPPTGKQQFGTVASGVGALAPWAKVGKA